MRSPVRWRKTAGSSIGVERSEVSTIWRRGPFLWLARLALHLGEFLAFLRVQALVLASVGALLAEPHAVRRPRAFCPSSAVPCWSITTAGACLRTSFGHQPVLKEPGSIPENNNG